MKKAIGMDIALVLAQGGCAVVAWMDYGPLAAIGWLSAAMWCVSVALADSLIAKQSELINDLLEENERQHRRIIELESPCGARPRGKDTAND